MGYQRILTGADPTFLAYVVFVGVGLLNCFFGYRLFRVLLGIWGFIGGAALSMTLLQGANVDPLVRIVGALIGGIIGAVLVSVLYLLGVFLFGVGFGLLVASVIQQHMHASPSWLLMIVLGAIGGVAAVVLQRPLITLFTAFGGAWVVVAGIASAIAGCSLNTFPAHCVRASPWALAILVAWVVLGFLGLAAQSRLGRGRGRSREEEDRRRR